MHNFDKDAVRESLKPYMTNAEIDKAIVDLMMRRNAEAPPMPNPPIDKPRPVLMKRAWFESEHPDYMRIASAQLHDRIRAEYPTIPHGPEPRNRRIQPSTLIKARPCFRCGAARECGCAA